ncbi:hypothetical protein EVAR_2303_1 [Eumeta japonica]|uniref:Uncharacterized protein n=1 Tax=Eumeta variegata TaxID=151549 RepID=A0A4C1SII9_EUMVA|nr:hypothetical protein EVAR_2303_1 [Eumeta japonica]
MTNVMTRLRKDRTFPPHDFVSLLYVQVYDQCDDSSEEIQNVSTPRFYLGFKRADCGPPSPNVSYRSHAPPLSRPLPPRRRSPGAASFPLANIESFGKFPKVIYSEIPFRDTERRRRLVFLFVDIHFAAINREREETTAWEYRSVKLSPEA